MNDFYFTVNCILESGLEVTHSGIAASTDEALGLVSEANQGFDVLEHNFTECEPVPTEDSIPDIFDIYEGDERF